ncbi:Myosin-1 [Actinoplanes sp. SE50]|uniref:DUF7507 domain-containing protein n=1 Tax=unclassified Actinoplanes TaxID=2626549 RepID=UPI00023EC817|nr:MULTISPECIES: hypothetical protein [unclassified Actinoplanes]AEV85923.1 Myosin-1 [Actinoplanes sp. SE50/110]ATO84319.1 Myosin-1 [Actinoplanes sp. SE50]SLM01729.1 hypothetical protein ACSP50_4967 [Actinoplanes sp. SE50/110]
MAADLYRVTQADIDAATAISDIAYADGIVPGAGRTVTSNRSSTSVPLTAPAPKLTGIQNAVWTDNDGDGRLGPGDDVVSTVLVTNSGNVTLINVRVTGLPDPVTCPTTQIPPGASVTCTSGRYHLTAAQIAAGKRTPQAHIAGDLLDPHADNVTADAPSTVAVPARKPTPSPSPSRSPGTGHATPAPTHVAQPGTPARPGGTFPITGRSAALAFLIGLGLLVAGGGLLFLARQRRPALHARR